LISTNPYLVGKILDNAGCHCHHRPPLHWHAAACNREHGRHGL